MAERDIAKSVGLQVVKLSDDSRRRCVLDEEALASVLLREDVCHLPVVVVSVAGAYRGGKSFMLNFFLRYLNASRSSQLNGEWLGNEDEILEGFEWRGGADSKTKGIHLWPEPAFVTNTKTGEKMAVFLMDTQGTFDTDSGMEDNSMVFALSTLLSSVQIYNLQRNIGEDDLQHLQLFTEYGRLLCEEQKTFQTLKFLIRDWMSPYGHPYGYVGGQALLNKKLQINSNQKKQLQEVRENIHSCFGKIQCFLMPHPGLAIAQQQFRGRLSDISQEFKMSLLELVPALFDPENLKPMTIDGDKIRVQDLLEFFKQYVNIFNSGDLPEATTIYQATADAAMMVALENARACYENTMEAYEIGEVCETSTKIQDWHKKAVYAALEMFDVRKILGSKERVAKHTAEFKKEIEAKLSIYLWRNELKVRATVSLAKNHYEQAMASVSEVQGRICLHPNDLEMLHRQTLQESLLMFQKARFENEENEERSSLVEHLELHYKHLCTVNEQNNKSAALEAREIYISRMKDGISRHGVSSYLLKVEHEEALGEAIKHFNSLRNQVTEEPEDIHKELITQDIAAYYENFQRMNFNSNMWAIEVGLSIYNNIIYSAWGPQSGCFHPKALDALHEEAKEMALKQFLIDRVVEQDEFKEQLIEKLESRYQELLKINKFNNNLAVDRAFWEYTRRMDKHTEPTLASVLIIPFFIKVFALLPSYHHTSSLKALAIFQERRRGESYNDDEYVKQLKAHSLPQEEGEREKAEMPYKMLLPNGTKK